MSCFLKRVYQSFVSEDTSDGTHFVQYLQFIQKQSYRVKLCVRVYVYTNIIKLLIFVWFSSFQHVQGGLKFLLQGVWFSITDRVIKRKFWKGRKTQIVVVKF